MIQVLLGCSPETEVKPSLISIAKDNEAELKNERSENNDTK
jgi:hypothetical protein